MFCALWIADRQNSTLMVNAWLTARQKLPVRPAVGLVGDPVRPLKIMFIKYL